MFGINYLSIFFFLIFSIVLSGIIFFLSYALSSKLDDAEKLTIYECGFNPFNDSRTEFNVKFYIVAILFLIFDLEISYLFPFVVCIDLISNVSVFFMLLFLFILTIGFFYEWKKGALDWDSFTYYNFYEKVQNFNHNTWCHNSIPFLFFHNFFEFYLVLVIYIYCCVTIFYQHLLQY